MILVDFKTLQQFHLPFNGDYDRDGLHVLKIDEYIIVDMSFNQEGGSNWLETEGVLDGLLAIRKQILDGDYRALYLGWLHFISLYWEMGLDEELLSHLKGIIEPPIFLPIFKKPQ